MAALWPPPTPQLAPSFELGSVPLLLAVPELHSAQSPAAMKKSDAQQAASPALKVVGFHVEGASPSPRDSPLLGEAPTNLTGSPSPVIIPPTFQASGMRRVPPAPRCAGSARREADEWGGRTQTPRASQGQRSGSEAAAHAAAAEALDGGGGEEGEDSVSPLPAIRTEHLQGLDRASLVPSECGGEGGGGGDGTAGAHVHR